METSDGPRYYYEAFPLLVLFTVGWLFKERTFDAKDCAGQRLFGLFVAGVAVSVPLLAYHALHERQVIEERSEPYRLVARAGVTNALVFLEQGRVGATRPMSVLDLTRNSPGFRDDVLYALDRGAENQTLRNFYPDRSCFWYRDVPDAHRGYLEPCRP